MIGGLATKEYWYMVSKHGHGPQDSSAVDTHRCGAWVHRFQENWLINAADVEFRKYAYENSL